MSDETEALRLPPLPETGYTLAAPAAPYKPAWISSMEAWDESAMETYARLAVKQAVAAEREACAKQVEPKGPRPCECVSCDGLEFCGSIKVSAVEEWDSKTECAAAIRARGEK